jgi:hypothetical protein
LRRIRHIDVTEICFPLLPQFSPPPAPVLLNVPLKFLSYDSVSECSSTDHFPCVALLNSCVDTQYLTPLFFHHGRSRLPPPVRAHCSEPPSPSRHLGRTPTISPASAEGLPPPGAPSAATSPLCQVIAARCARVLRRCQGLLLELLASPSRLATSPSGMPSSPSLSSAIRSGATHPCWDQPPLTSSSR